MTNRFLLTEQETLPLEKRISLIKKYPLFCLLNSEDFQKLAAISKEISVLKGTLIINEGDILDGFFFIESGTAEVTRVLSRIGENETIHLATLEQGDAIGLGDTDFFSQNGLRTATVTASSTMKLLFFDLEDFYEFLKQNGNAYPELKKTTELFLMIKFISQIEYINHYLKSNLIHLARKTKKITVDAETLLIKEGEMANDCYFLLSGRVAITKSNKLHSDHLIKEISAPHIIGEGALMDDEKRNATVITQTACELLVLNKNYLSLVDMDNSLKKYLQEMRISQIRPKRFQPSNTFKLSTLEQIILSESDGKKTLEEILSDHQEKFNKLSILDLYATIIKLKNLNLLEFQEIQSVQKNKSHFLKKLIKFFQKRDT